MEQFRALLGGGAARRGTPKEGGGGGGGGKYNVAPRALRTYRGRAYDSRAEMRYAIRLAADANVRLWIPQPIVQLGEDFTYRPDFFVLYRDGEAVFVDVKGAETQAFKKTKRLWAKYGLAPLHVVKAIPGGAFEVVQAIG